MFDPHIVYYSSQLNKSSFLMDLDNKTNSDFNLFMSNSEKIVGNFQFDLKWILTDMYRL